MNDVVYLLGKGSKHDNMEIRYSLRSVAKYLKDRGSVFIIGTDPGFTQNVTIIPHEDVHANKARNIMEKISALCHDERISDNFMLFNDDYFLMKDISAVDYPFYHKCKLQDTMLLQRNDYVRHVTPTFLELRSRGLRTWNFDVHKPIIYNKKKFLEVMAQYDWNRDWGYIVRSLYCNTLKITGEYQKDHKIAHATVPEKWVKHTEDVECFSIDDCSVNEHFKMFIDKVFPHSCMFEKQERTSL